MIAGAGAESRSRIGRVIVGGFAFGTLLALFVVPTADRRRPTAAQRAEAEVEPERQAAEWGAAGPPQ